MSLSAKAITTLTNVKQLLAISDTDSDTYLERLIESVSAYIESATGRVWLDAYATAITEYPDPVGSLLFLKALPVKEITSITDGTTALDYTDDDDGDYRYEHFKEEGIVERVGSLESQKGWQAGMRKVTVVYKGGYENQTALPADIVLAADSLVAELYKAAERTGVTSESMGSYSVSYQDVDRASQALPGFLATLKRYKNVKIG